MIVISVALLVGMGVISGPLGNQKWPNSVACGVVIIRNMEGIQVGSKVSYVNTFR